MAEDGFGNDAREYAVEVDQTLRSLLMILYAALVTSHPYRVGGGRCLGGRATVVCRSLLVSFVFRFLGQYPKIGGDNRRLATAPASARQYSIYMSIMTSTFFRR